MNQTRFNFFQIALLGGAGLFAIIGFMLFAGIIPSPWGNSSNKNYGTITVWGTIPAAAFKDAWATAYPNIDTLRVTYVAKSSQDFNAALTGALANGAGPDAVILAQEDLYAHKEQLVSLGVNARDFKNTFITEGELYLDPAGPLAMPLVVDPMVMYWNRDLYAAGGVASAPTSWTAFYTDPLQGITKRGATQGSITQSVLAFGQFQNVTHAKDILAMLMLQTGDPITAYQQQQGSDTQTLVSMIANSMNAPAAPAASALRFYTRFADPVRIEYSWNGSLPFSQDFFAQGGLATYFGYASERATIASKNPHLNFDVAVVPQAANEAGAPGVPATFGELYAYGVLRQAPNQAGALYGAQVLAAARFVGALSSQMNVAPARRDLLGVRSADPYQDIANRSALIAHGWIDPSPTNTARAFQLAIEDVLSGRRQPQEAVNTIDSRINELISQSSTSL
ncbi:MAG: ABC transporter substrate-binding protein [Minisyncoccota bacterium]